MKILVFDTETGGLSPKIHSVFSVGALVGDLDSGEIIDSFEVLNKLHKLEDYVYTAKSIEIHGITPEQAFAEGIPTEEIQTKFMDLWMNHGAAILGGHNAVRYDVDMMAHQIYKIEPEEFMANFTYRFVDTQPVIRLFTGNNDAPSGASLTQIVKALNIDVDEYGKNKFHNALFDSICAFKVMHKFRNIFKEKDFLSNVN